MKSALQGVPAAQFNLGNMYYLGKGVERDLVEAEKWYRLAEEKGYRNAKRFREHLEQHRDIAELDSNFVIHLIPQ